MLKKYTDRFEAIQKLHEEALERFSARVREELVVPACRRHKLVFLSGMGTFFFRRASRKDGDQAEPMYGDAGDFDMPAPYGYKHISKAAQETLKPIVDLLNLEVSYGQYVGYFVSDVNETKEKKHG